MVAMNPDSESSENVVGDIIRRQRELAELSMRQVAAMAGISNPYLSQIEHGLRAPSEAVLDTIAATLGVSPETLRPGMDDDHGSDENHDHDQEGQPTEHTSLLAAISTDPGLTPRQRRALTEIYTAMTESTAGRRSQRSR
jgi:transcriptional regulator with XRE-family HTH domain